MDEESCTHQDRLSYAAVTNNSQISVLEQQIIIYDACSILVDGEVCSTSSSLRDLGQS